MFRLYLLHSFIPLYIYIKKSILSGCWNCPQIFGQQYLIKILPWLSLTLFKGLDLLLGQYLVLVSPGHTRSLDVEPRAAERNRCWPVARGVTAPAAAIEMYRKAESQLLSRPFLPLLQVGITSSTAALFGTVPFNPFPDLPLEVLISQQPGGSVEAPGSRAVCSKWEALMFKNSYLGLSKL